MEAATAVSPQPKPDARLDELLVRVGAGLQMVFLDAGNTLIYVDWPRVAGWCGQEGFPVTAEALVRAEYTAKAAFDAVVSGRRPPLPEGFFGVALEAAGVGPRARGRILERIHQAEHAGIMWLSVREGTGAALERIRRLGLRLAVISNADGRVEAFLEQAGLREYLEFVIDSGVVGVEKPHPRIFQVALERAGIAPHEALHVGDLCSVDVAGARAAGVEPVLMDPLGLYATCDAPRVHSIGELAEALERHRPAASDV